MKIEQHDRPITPPSSNSLLKAPHSPEPTPRPKVSLRPSAVFTWLLVTFILAAGPLGLAVPDQSGSAYFSAGALGGLAIIGALLLAELRRARAMSAAGLKVTGVEIGLLRARVIADGTVDSPRDLRRISWAGPIAYAISGGLLAAIGGLLLLAGSPGFHLLGAAALMTAAGVAVLAVSELLPTPGSAGSQLIYARAWRRSGYRDAAVLATARAGVVTGWLLLAAGAVLIALVSFAGIWLLLIGWMTLGGSKLALAGARARQRVAGLRALDVMSPAPPEVPAFATAGRAFTEVALPHRASVLLVREADGSFGGAVTSVALAAVPGDDRETVRVQRLAIGAGDLAIVSASDPMEHVLDEMAAHPVAGVAIVLEDESPTGPPPNSAVAGIITPSDVAHAIALSTAHSAPARSF